MIAYSFWHSPAPGVSVPQYEEALATFVGQLARAGIPGLRSCRSVRFEELPWIDGRPAYEDWYELDDTSSLDSLEAGAVGVAMSAPHGAIARLAGQGSGGLFARRSEAPAGALPHTAESGPVPGDACRVAWVDKPAGTPYSSFLPLLTSAAGSRAPVWQRRLSLGPAREFCVWLPAPAGANEPGEGGEGSLPAGALVVRGIVVASGVAR